MIKWFVLTEVTRDLKIKLATEPFDTGHDVIHHYEVWKSCLWIVEQERIQQKVNLEALQIAAWGHDLERKSQTHDKLREIMAKYNYSDGLTQKVVSIINGHSHDDEQNTLEAQVLFDADKLEYVSRLRWQAVLQAERDGVMTKELFARYKSAWNERMEYIPAKLHFVCTKQRFQEYLKDFISWATNEGIYKDGKLA